MNKKSIYSSSSFIFETASAVKKLWLRSIKDRLVSQSNIQLNIIAPASSIILHDKFNDFNLVFGFLIEITRGGIEVLLILFFFRSND